MRDRRVKLDGRDTSDADGMIAPRYCRKSDAHTFHVNTAKGSIEWPRVHDQIERDGRLERALGQQPLHRRRHRSRHLQVSLQFAVLGAKQFAVCASRFWRQTHSPPRISMSEEPEIAPAAPEATEAVQKTEKPAAEEPAAASSSSEAASSSSKPWAVSLPDEVNANLEEGDEEEFEDPDADMDDKDEGAKVEW